MKKTIVTLALALAVGFAGINMAEARWGGGGYGPGQGGCNGPRGGQFSEEEQEARQEFFHDTKELRDQLRDKQAAYFDEMNKDDADKDIAGEIWSEIFELQSQIQAKAAEAGIERGFGRGRSYANKGGNTSPCGGPGSYDCYNNQQ